MKCEFVTSATKEAEWPQSNLPEIVVVGRSNVGKSSFINALCQRKKLAYVGNTPGKTRLINFFAIDDQWMLVDVPGYGYARMSKSMLIQMGKMMDEYFTKREQIACVVILIDARHDATEDDLDMVEYVRCLKIPYIIVATKIDKVPKTHRIRSLKRISNQAHTSLKEIYAVSSIEKTGFEPVMEAIQEQIQSSEEQ
ncbi:MAG: YihA family ribosome biogenesis GTP-binding protein [Erysipelotrichaceae bacterium]|nr:YihA family ribosome biogenesis GTP-binding protein [Erysipelotrichaceae bacterium]